MRTFLSLCVLLTGLASMAQIDLPERLQLDGSAPSDRQVLGVATPDAATNGASAGTLREQRLQHGIAAGTDQLALTLSPGVAAYTPGMTLSVEPTATNTGPATLEVDGLGPIPLMKHGNLPLDSGDLIAGVPFHAVYDGLVFQVVSQTHPACPVGFSVISRDVCMQTTVNDSTTFYGATVYCVSRGTRLCTMAEWYQGCAMPGGFEPTLAAFEWVDDAANNNNYAKRMGSNSAGLFGCKLGGLATPVTQVAFRCCWDR